MPMEEEAEAETDDGCKWVKTDSECQYNFLFIHIHSFFLVHMEEPNLFSSCRYCFRDLTNPPQLLTSLSLRLCQVR